MSKQSKYGKEFKIEAVKLAMKSESVVATARELGMSDKTLHNWIKQYRDNPDSAFPGTGHLTSEKEELRKLRLEVKKLKETNDILKKAASYFAIHSK